MRKAVYVTAALVVLLLVGKPEAGADSWLLPVPFTVNSEDGKRVFQFTPNDMNADATAGVYDSGDPPALIYSVKGLRSWAYESNFLFSADMRYIVFIPQPTMSTALQFYDRGVMKKEYAIEDLVDDIDAVRRSTSSLWWMKSRSETSIADNTLTIDVSGGLTYTFDIRTGAIVAGAGKNETAPYMILFPAGACVIGCAAYLYFRIRYKKEANP